MSFERHADCTRLKRRSHMLVLRDWESIPGPRSAAGSQSFSHAIQALTHAPALKLLIRGNFSEH